MGLLNSIKDHFTNAEFSVAPNKKVKTICADFKNDIGSTEQKDYQRCHYQEF